MRHLVLAIALWPVLASAHELERTNVRVAFARDGTFVVDVSNDPAWLLLRLEPFAGRAVPAALTSADRDRRLAELAPVFVDRVVLFVDGREVRPESCDYLRAGADPIGIYRLRGHLPRGSRSLRWFYGLVIDPYRLTIRHANGDTETAWIAGEAWSAPIDVSGEFLRPYWVETGALVAIFLVLLGLRIGRRPRRLRSA